MEKSVRPLRAVEKALLAAIRAKDLAAVQRALKAGASPNAREVQLTLPNALKNEPGRRRYYADTALILAVARGSEPIVHLLLERGADINGRSHDKVTPLMAAAIYEEVGIIRLLLSRGALVNLTDKNGATPLDRVIDPLTEPPKRPEIVSLLLRAGGKRLAKPEWPAEGVYREYELEEKRIQKLVRSWPQRDLPVIPEDNALMKIFLPDVSEAVTKGKTFRREQDKFVDFVIDSKTRNLDGRYGRSEEQEFQVTLELRRSLLVRNQKSITWESLDLPESFRFVVSHPETGPRGVLSPADTWLWIKASLPGYARNYHAAVVHFTFGITYHRYSGVYYMEKRANQWRVVWRNLGYFL